MTCKHRNYQPRNATRRVLTHFLPCIPKIHERRQAIETKIETEYPQRPKTAVTEPKLERYRSSLLYLIHVEEGPPEVSRT